MFRGENNTGRPYRRGMPIIKLPRLSYRAESGRDGAAFDLRAFTRRRRVCGSLIRAETRQNGIY